MNRYHKSADLKTRKIKESFFAALKKEKLYRIDTTKLKREEVKKIVWMFIVYYNRRRITTMNPKDYSPAIYRDLFETGLFVRRLLYPPSSATLCAVIKGIKTDCNHLMRTTSRCSASGLLIKTGSLNYGIKKRLKSPLSEKRTVFPHGI